MTVSHVVTWDGGTATVTVFGPFADRVAATTWAEDWSRQNGGSMDYRLSDRPVLVMREPAPAALEMAA